MSDYHEARREVKELIESQWRDAAVAKGHPDPSDLDKFFGDASEKMLDTYERLVNQRVNQWGPFMWGVLQSFVGSFLFLLFLYVCAFLISANKQNFFYNTTRILWEEPGPPATGK